MWRGRSLHRGDYTRECIEALRALFEERRSSYEGTYISFEDVESYPKPIQDPLPILSGGNAPGTRLRAGTLCQGWMPACLTVAEIASGMSNIERIADEHGREFPRDFDVALQVAVSIGPTHEAAIKSFEASQIYAHTRSLSKSTLKGKQSDYQDRNLIGTAESVAEQIAAYGEAGVTTMAALLFTCDTIAETIEAMEEFASEVIPLLGVIDVKGSQ
jgi:alkanesulfonate monooxygenase SsuD/methylene tetrahydromethanopterin reductase-like flavin-dependent oxidoreductase (luciferase family)